MLYEDGAREIIAKACEAHGFDSEAQMIRDGLNIAFHIDIAIAAVTAGYDLAADQAAEDAAGASL